jgi:hypothetical protein
VQGGQGQPPVGLPAHARLASRRVVPASADPASTARETTSLVVQLRAASKDCAGGVCVCFRFLVAGGGCAKGHLRQKKDDKKRPRSPTHAPCRRPCRPRRLRRQLWRWRRLVGRPGGWRTPAGRRAASFCMEGKKNENEVVVGWSASHSQETGGAALVDAANKTPLPTQTKTLPSPPPTPSCQRSSPASCLEVGCV